MPASPWARSRSGRASVLSSSLSCHHLPPLTEPCSELSAAPSPLPLCRGSSEASAHSRTRSFSNAWVPLRTGAPSSQWWVGPTSNNIDATSPMWAFFRDHRLRRNGRRLIILLRLPASRTLRQHHPLG